MIRSRRAEVSRDLPLYARLLGLRHLAPSGFLCFVFLEGAIALGVLLALAELVTWWGVLVLPVTVAVMVKLNDVVAGALTRAAPAAAPAVAGPSAPPSLVRPAAAARSVSGRSVDGRSVDERWASTPVRPMAGPVPEFTMDERSLARARTVDLRNPDGNRAAAAPTVTTVETGGPNGPALPWADELDQRVQRNRQSAVRRYE